MRRAARVACALLAFLAVPAPGRAQAPPPDGEWLTLETEHVRVTFPPALEALGRHTAARAEVAWAALARHVARPPDGPVDIIVTDNTDISNGYATPFYTNRVVLFAPPPVTHLALSFHRDWLDLVLVHELAHIFHLDVPWSRVPWLRDVFGRAPLPWLFFSAVGSPSWAVEGLATVVESELTGAGRVHGSYHEMVVRTAILEDAFPGIDRVTGETPIWPGGERRYIYGSLFLDWLRHRHGEDALAEIVEETADGLPPAQLFFDAIGKGALGTSFTDAYRAWRAELETRYRALSDSLGARGLTATERVGVPGRWALFPRVSPDGRRLAYGLDDGRDDPAVAVVDLARGEVVERHRRNGGGSVMGPAAWLPGGAALLTSELELGDPYHLYEDLYRIGEGGRRRLTEGARLLHPTVSADGARAVAVQNRSGTNRLVEVDVATGAVTALTSFDPDRHWALPRLSPDGERIAVGVWRRSGLHDVVVLDRAGAPLAALAPDRAIDQAPAWSPDGRWVLFASDRTGISNLYAWEVETGRLLQATSVLGGAFYPDVSPDGRWVYFSAYHADGFHIERIPFRPEAWRPAPPPLERLAEAAELPAPVPAPQAAAASPLRPYSAWATARPHFWLPLSQAEDGGGEARTAWGVFTAGADVLGRHAYEIALLYEPEEGLPEGTLTYRWAGLGNPVLSLSVERDWDFAFQDTLSDGATADVFSRGDVARLSATFSRPRWRHAAALTLGGELVDDAVLLRNAPEGVAFGETADVRDRLGGAFARASWSNSRAHAWSISREEGVSLSLTARQRWDTDARPARDSVPGRDASYRELAPWGAAYRSVRVFGFADHVLAARASGLLRDGPFAPRSGVGGASGGDEGLGIGEPLGGSLFLPVRGFHTDARRGTRAWSASLEYRFPVALVGRGVRLWPVFLDRISGAFFADAGDAWCAQDQAEARSGCSVRAARALVSAGAELSLDGLVLYNGYLRVRTGLAVPLQPGGDPALYVRLGSSF